MIVHKCNLITLAVEMHKISKIISPFFMRDRMTEKLVPYNTRSTTKVEKDGSGSFRCTKKSNYEIPSTETD